MTKCDLCHASVDRYGLSEIQEEFQADNLKHICHECEKEITSIHVDARCRVDALFAKVKRSLWWRFVHLKWGKQ